MQRRFTCSKKGGSFIKKSEPAFEKFIDFEDVALLLFDADKDGDLDVAIGPGGNNNASQSRQTQLRFFSNDGKGNFTLNSKAFPDCGVNVSVITANDFDNDGDLDLFVGGRSQPKTYGVNTRSFILQNNGSGIFKDITQAVAPAITNIGMVTGALWADVQGDKNKELIVCGEWMAPQIFSFLNNQFKPVKTNLADMLGWWRSVSVADVNGDGKQDLVLGNIGENFYLHPDKSNPVKLWLNDFNQNGNTDKILTHTVNGKDMPVFLKRDMQDEVPLIKKQNLQHSEYAKKSIQELLQLISCRKVW